MQRTEKKRRGPLVVLAILLFAALGGGLTWLRYAREHPAATRAHLSAPGSIVAEFPVTAPPLREGMKASVSFPGEAHTARIASAALLPGAKRQVIELRLDRPSTLPTGSACQATVDMTVPPELLKNSPR